MLLLALYTWQFIWCDTIVLIVLPYGTKNSILHHYRQNNKLIFVFILHLYTKVLN